MDDLNQTTPVPVARPRMPAQVLAMAYVPMQVWENLYDPEKGFRRATLFVDLDLPYLGKKV